MTEPIIPQPLRAGDQVALFAPAFYATPEQVNQAVTRVQALNLQVTNTINLDQHDGYFANTAETAVSAIHASFANPQIKALISVRGGYGCARLLPLLDWRLIKANPKIVLGFSDVTALLIAIHQQTGLVTFHGPSASMPWPEFTQNYLRETLFARTPVHYTSQNHHEIITLRGGSATGELIGGNLSVLTSLIGSTYLPSDWRNKILFLEDVHEEVYRLDRMFMQLKLANILPQIKGLICGRFNDCTTKTQYSFSVMQLLTRIAQDLNIPVLANMPFGHQPEMVTFPIGAPILMDADTQSLKLLLSEAIQAN